MAQNTPADWQGDYVSFHRNNRTRDFTVMGNIHLRDKNLSLKAVGLLSKMLSFNDSWQFSTRGLAAICKEGPDAILSTLMPVGVLVWTLRGVTPSFHPSKYQFSKVLDFIRPSTCA